MELLIGCGRNHAKKITLGGRAEWSALTTLDMTADVNPNVVHDLDVLPYPFEDNQFNEIHAYDVLEHQGRQGDWKFYFDQFAEFWRILKHGGVLCGICPKALSPWAWGDPGHTRIISPECLMYLSQKAYTSQPQGSPMTDYRFHYKADFNIIALDTETLPHQFQFVLQAIKE